MIIFSKMCQMSLKTVRLKLDYFTFSSRNHLDRHMVFNPSNALSPPRQSWKPSMTFRTLYSIWKSWSAWLQATETASEYLKDMHMQNGWLACDKAGTGCFWSTASTLRQVGPDEVRTAGRGHRWNLTSLPDFVCRCVQVGRRNAQISWLLGFLELSFLYEHLWKGGLVTWGAVTSAKGQTAMTKYFLPTKCCIISI